jgi:putative addiction module CopG family antidote
MSTMNISLPDSLKAFVDEQVSQRGYGTSSEYVRELIRRVSAPAFIAPQPSRRPGAPPE